MSIRVTLMRADPALVSALDQGLALLRDYLYDMDDDHFGYPEIPPDAFQDPQVPVAISLEQRFALITYQLSPAYRNPRTSIDPWAGEATDDLAAIVAGMRTVEGALDFARHPPYPPREPDFPLRTSNPAEVKRLSETLGAVSEKEFLTVHTHEQPERPYIYHWYSITDEDSQMTFRNTLINLKTFYRAAAEADQAMLHSKK